MNFKKNCLFAAAILALTAVVTGGGCGGSGGDSRPPVKAYIDGELHGDMAGALTDYLDEARYDNKSTDRMLIISRADNSEIDDATAAGAKATLAAGQPVVIEHADEKEINNFLSKIGIEPNFKTESADVPVELFAVEKREGNTFFFVSTNDAPAPQLPLETEEKEYIISGDENSEKSEVISNSRTVSTDKPSGSDNAAIMRHRVQNFISWATSGNERITQLSAERQKNSADDLRTLASASVWDRDLSTGKQTYTIRYTIYSCHSFKQKKDYYLISQSAQLNPSSEWRRTQEGHVSYPKIYTAKVEGQTRKYTFKNYWEEFNYAEVPLVKSSPQNANEVTTVTSGYTWSAEGNIGFSGLTATGGLSGGVSYSSSESFNVSDCRVNDRCGDDGKRDMASWEYEFKNPENGSRYFYWTDLKDAPLLSRSNFQPVNQWVWCVPRDFSDQKNDLSFISEFGWQLGQSEGAVNVFYIEHTAAKHRSWKTLNKTFLVPLSKPPLIVLSAGQVDFTKSGESKSVKLVSAKDWTSESSQNWCKIQETSGTSTNGESTAIHITVSPNNTGENREAKVKLTSKDGKDMAEVKVFQSQY